MPRITMIVGIVLMALGVGFFIASGATMEKATALIPAAFGLPVAILGMLAARGGEKMRMHTAHVAVMLTLLGALGGLGMGIRGFLKPEPNHLAIADQLLMGVICVLHVILSVRSFIAARKAREAAAAETAGTGAAAGESGSPQSDSSSED